MLLSHTMERHQGWEQNSNLTQMYCTESHICDFVMLSQRPFDYTFKRRLFGGMAT